MGWHAQLTSKDKMSQKEGSEELLESTVKSFSMAKEGIHEILPKAKRVFQLLTEKKELNPKQENEKNQLKTAITKIQGRVPGLDEVNK